MASKIFGPHQRRTREHIIADLSVHCLEGFILEEGHTFEEFRRDYGYDIAMTTHDEDGFVEPVKVFFQVKASENLKAIGDSFVFDLDIRDYNLWIADPAPVVLVPYDATLRCAFWVAIKDYFSAPETRQPRHGARSIRVRIPKESLLTRDSIAELRRLKTSWIAK